MLSENYIIMGRSRVNEIVLILHLFFVIHPIAKYDFMLKTEFIENELADV